MGTPFPDSNFSRFRQGSRQAAKPPLTTTLKIARREFPRPCSYGWLPPARRGFRARGCLPTANHPLRTVSVRIIAAHMPPFPPLRSPFPPRVKGGERPRITLFLFYLLTPEQMFAIITIVRSVTLTLPPVSNPYRCEEWRPQYWWDG